MAGLHFGTWGQDIVHMPPPMDDATKQAIGRMVAVNDRAVSDSRDGMPVTVVGVDAADIAALAKWFKS